MLRDCDPTPHRSGRQSLMCASRHRAPRAHLARPLRVVYTPSTASRSSISLQKSEPKIFVDQHGPRFRRHPRTDLALPELGYVAYVIMSQEDVDRIEQSYRDDTATSHSVDLKTPSGHSSPTHAG